MTEEAETNLAFDNLPRGTRLQVDINDPRVAALVAAGYLKIHWKEPSHGLDSPGDTSGFGGISDAGVGAGQPGSKKRKTPVSDGAGGAGSGEGPANRAAAGDTAGAQDDTGNPDRG